MDKKPLLIITIVLIAAAVLTGVAVYMNLSPLTSQVPTQELDFTVSGSSDCLRFLNSTVPTVYVPFTVASNQQYKLTVNATKMPGGANGWTDVYLYEGIWDQGTNHTCKAEDLYPIIGDIKSADFAIKANRPYIQTFGGTTQQSYTVFFVMPPGGQATFHITLKQI